MKVRKSAQQVRRVLGDIELEVNDVLAELGLVNVKHHVSVVDGNVVLVFHDGYGDGLFDLEESLRTHGFVKSSVSTESYQFWRSI